MKIIYTALLALLCTVTSVQAFTQCTTCTITHSNNSVTNYSLSSGQTLCIKKDFRGDIVNFPAGATICIAPGISFEPANFNNAGGIINNYGTFGKTVLTVNSGFTLNNYGTATFTNFTGNGSVTINNEGTITVSNLDVPDGSVITNNSALTVTTLTAKGATIVTNNSSATFSSVMMAGGSTFNNNSTLTASSFTFNGAATFNNNGAAKFTSITTSDGSAVNNYGAISTNSFTINGVNNIENFDGATIFTNSISTLSSGSFIRNGGQVFIVSHFNTAANSSIENKVGGKLYISSNLSADGKIANNGYIRVHGSATLNSSASLVNNCAFISGGQLTNNSASFKNFGSILIVNNNGATNFQNSGTIYNSPAGYIQGYAFSNDGFVTGGGGFRFTGTTSSQNSFGVDADEYSINFYDVSLASGKRFMDTELGAFGNVTRSTLSVKDTTNLLHSCAVTENSVLPLQLTSFSGNVTSNSINFSWQVAENETGSHFELQKSTSGANFKTVSLLFTTEKNGTENYAFADEASTGSNLYYRLKMINKDQSISYSQVLYFTVFKQGQQALVLHQNPVQHKVSFNYTATVNGVAVISVYNLSGIKMNTSRVQVQKGINGIDMSINSRWNKGIYVLEVWSNGTRQTTKFIKQ